MDEKSINEQKEKKKIIITKEMQPVNSMPNRKKMLE